MTKEDELYFLKRFENLYDSFPEGKIIPSEQPDFIIKNEDFKIGIEITELFQDSHLNGYSKYQQKSISKNYFTNKYIKLIQKYLSFTFHINIEFNESQSINKLNQNSILKRLCNPIILNNFINLKNKEHIIIEDFRVLPDEINSIQLGRYDDIDESFDEMAEGGPVADINNSHIEYVLAKKHQKLEKYQNCSEQWLLITEGNYYAGSFADYVVNNPIKSKFHKIFLLRSNLDKVIIVK